MANVITSVALAFVLLFSLLTFVESREMVSEAREGKEAACEQFRAIQGHDHELCEEEGSE